MLYSITYYASGLAGLLHPTRPTVAERGREARGPHCWMDGDVTRVTARRDSGGVGWPCGPRRAEGLKQFEARAATWSPPSGRAAKCFVTIFLKPRPDAEYRRTAAFQMRSKIIFGAVALRRGCLGRLAMPPPLQVGPPQDQPAPLRRPVNRILMTHIPKAQKVVEVKQGRAEHEGSESCERSISIPLEFRSQPARPAWGLRGGGGAGHVCILHESSPALAGQPGHLAGARPGLGWG